jgi:tetraprenyl-beta-curcumene synthase
MSSGATAAPLTRRTVGATARAAGRELGWGLRGVRADQAHRRDRARRIADPALRADALAAIAAKRSVTNGAAFFWTLPPQRSAALHRLLLAFQTLANLLDVLSERDAAQADAAPRPWVLAIGDAVDPGAPPRRPGGLDGGGGDYLDALVAACRDGCAALPAFAAVRPVLAREAGNARALDLEHDPDPVRRHAALRAFAEERLAGTELEWFELTAGASSMLTVIVTLALAADARTTAADAEDAVAAYRTIAALSALLDNYIDQFEDRGSWVNNYLELYPSPEAAVARLGTLIERSLAAAAALRDGDRHVVLVATMVAMFLTSRSVTEGPAAASTRALLARSGPLTRALVGPLLAWRRVHRFMEG